MNIGEMKSKLTTQGIARDNRWLCRIYPPPGLSNTNKTISNLISRGPLDWCYQYSKVIFIQVQ